MFQGKWRKTGMNVNSFKEFHAKHMPRNGQAGQDVYSRRVFTDPITLFVINFETLFCFLNFSVPSLHKKYL